MSYSFFFDEYSMSTCWYSLRFSRSFLICGASRLFFSRSCAEMSRTIAEISSSVLSLILSTSAVRSDAASSLSCTPR